MNSAFHAWEPPIEFLGRNLYPVFDNIDFLDWLLVWASRSRFCWQPAFRLIALFGRRHVEAYRLAGIELLGEPDHHSKQISRGERDSFTPLHATLIVVLRSSETQRKSLAQLH